MFGDRLMWLYLFVSDCLVNILCSAFRVKLQLEGKLESPPPAPPREGFIWFAADS